MTEFTPHANPDQGSGSVESLARSAETAPAAIFKVPLTAPVGGPRADAPGRALLRKGRVLEVFTLAWNAVEAVVAVWSGLLAGSTALIGFGVDALIESGSGAILLWRLQEGEAGEGREALALRLVGVSFLALAAWVGWDALGALLTRDAPDESLAGICLAAASLVVMPALARAKRKVARGLGSRALEADSRQTDLCAYLSAILLGGLALNAALGWWWADPVAGLVMVPIIGREGLGALRGETCSDCHPSVGPLPQDPGGAVPLPPPRRQPGRRTVGGGPPG
ncbi:MAG: cation diffusion facilitator family transporter [Longimicrobiales bacterium]